METRIPGDRLDNGMRFRVNGEATKMFHGYRYYTIKAAVQIRTRVETGSNTSTVTLRVVGGDEKGSLETETVKCGHESYGTRTRK
jgi:hypothetical protein